MSRRFKNTHTLVVATGGATGTDRADTIVVLVRPFDADFNALTTTSDYMTGRATSTAVWELFTSSSKPFNLGDFDSGGSVLGDKDTWYVVAATKVAGAGGTYRYHVAPIGGAWTHTSSGTGGDNPGATDNVLFGTGPTIGQSKFDIAAAAVFSGTLNDAAVEALGTTDMADWMAASPLAAWQFNQASVADPVTDLTDGGADQTSISGTEVAPDPVGWTYFTASPGAGTVDLALTLDLGVTGVAEHAGTFDVGLPIAVTASGITDRSGTFDVGVVIDPAAEGPPSPVQNIIPASFAVVTGVGQCVINELETTVAGVPDRVCLIVPGSIVWDSCDCGQFAQTITTEWPSNAFPASAADQRSTPCGPPVLVITVTASIVRCVPTLDNAGHPPTCDALAAAALVIEQDRRALREAVSCCLKDLRDRYKITDFAVGTTTAVGEQGGCAGVELSYQFGVNNVCCG